ncbi:hypothetical protein SAXI111661_21690 [Saccharomonospora xinjiangensis]|nr:hypothetical protein EYD13_14180 [Saccharomonospora xinjiangensis]
MHGLEALDMLGRRQCVQLVERRDGMVDGAARIGVLRSRRWARHRTWRGFGLSVHLTTLTDPGIDVLCPTAIQPSSHGASADSARASAARTDDTGADQAT